MAQLVTFDGTGFSNGHVLVAGDAGSGDTSITAVVGSPTISDSNTPYSQSDERSFSCNNSSTNCYDQWNLSGAQSSMRIRFYLYTPASLGASALNNIARFADTSTSRMGLSFPGTGSPWSLRIADGTSTNVINSTTNILAASTWYQVEAGMDWLSSTSATYYLQIYNMSGTQLYSTSASGNPNGTAPNRVYVGETSQTPTLTLGYSHISVTDAGSTTIGPWAVSAGRTVSVWNGTSEVPATMTVWDGTTEKPATLS